MKSEYPKVDQSISNGHRSQLEDSNKNYELSFEYLISKDNLKWITLRTEHATFISVCLQSKLDLKEDCGFTSMLLKHGSSVDETLEDSKSEGSISLAYPWMQHPASIVDELMRQKGGAGPGVRARRAALTYLRRDGSSHVVTPSSSSDTLSSANGDSYNSGSSREIFSVQKLTEKFASVAFKSGKDCVENNAFEAIGDEEL
ncbi:hypothetical protein MSG28_010006 [Choristoneura fumiferana]|uniref:Uncharacterized protein n=1 Tax=Choristoneura fumiferana TaxID=7141 RepID=A0ACC0KJK0_CHOFU|nr:hypothetical protein MSG28_010006 [Choristoneura fumiferana]